MGKKMRIGLTLLLFSVFTAALPNISYAQKVNLEHYYDFLWLGASSQNTEGMLVGYHLTFFEWGRVSFPIVGAGIGGSTFPEGTRDTQWNQYDPGLYLTLPVSIRLTGDACDDDGDGCCPIFFNVTPFRNVIKGRYGVFAGISVQPWK